MPLDVRRKVPTIFNTRSKRNLDSKFEENQRKKRRYTQTRPPPANPNKRKSTRNDAEASAANRERQWLAERMQAVRRQYEMEMMQLMKLMTQIDVRPKQKKTKR